MVKFNFGLGANAQDDGNQDPNALKKPFPSLSPQEDMSLEEKKRNLNIETPLKSPLEASTPPKNDGIFLEIKETDSETSGKPVDLVSPDFVIEKETPESVSEEPIKDVEKRKEVILPLPKLAFDDMEKTEESFPEDTASAPKNLENPKKEELMKAMPLEEDKSTLIPEKDTPSLSLSDEAPQSKRNEYQNERNEKLEILNNETKSDGKKVSLDLGKNTLKSIETPNTSLRPTFLSFEKKNENTLKDLQEIPSFNKKENKSDSLNLSNTEIKPLKNQEDFDPEITISKISQQFENYLNENKNKIKEVNKKIKEAEKEAQDQIKNFEDQLTLIKTNLEQKKKELLAEKEAIKQEEKQKSQKILSLANQLQKLGSSETSAEAA